MTPASDKPGRSVRTLCTLAIGAVLLLSPWLAHADPFSLLRLYEPANLASTAAQRDARRSLVVALNRSGDMVLQHANIAITVSRKPFEDDQALREMLKRLHLQVTPASGGIRVKVAYSF